jgi:phosphotransferase system enzyme I (PtsP)
MLDILRRIVQEVSTAPNLDKAVGIIVHRVKEAMAVDACNVYLKDAAAEHYVLMATEGLNPEAVGRLRFGRGEGLVGMVAERQGAVNVENTLEHPGFQYLPELGGEPYHAFLGVPLIHYGRVVGVLVTRSKEQRLFNEEEVAFLVTIAAQLAGAINDVGIYDAVSRLARERSATSSFIQGIKGSPGIAIGTIALLSPYANLASVPDRKVKDVVVEENTFRAAVTAVSEEFRRAHERISGALPMDARVLLDVYMMVLDGDRLVLDTVERIRAGNWAPGALRATIAEHARVFEQMEDPYLQARAEDIRALGERILLHLQAGPIDPPQYPQRAVLVGEEISIPRLATVPVEKLAAIVCLRGSALSHTAVLARALGIPSVMGIGELPLDALEGRRIVVDGYQERILIEPSSAVLEEFERLVQEEAKLVAELGSLRDLPAETEDGVPVPMYLNAGLVSDIAPSLDGGIAGVGLYRTELPFLVRESFPGEEEQYQIYRQVLAAFAPKAVSMRTLDVGGDKALPYFTIQEDNPFLGWRGIRLTLDHPEIFLTQLRAMLRANAGLNNLQVMFPMISRVSELDEAMVLLEHAHRELTGNGMATGRPRLGAMIEVPSAVYLAKELAERVDFLSIGTNDLTQYILAVDRNNQQVARLYDGLHPAVLRAVHHVVEAAHREGTPVTVCGEMAGDPAGTILLVGMGIDGLSMSYSSFPRVKWAIRQVTRQRACELLIQALAMPDEGAVRRLLNNAFEEAGLNALVQKA